jgi:hypothetical protein
VTRKLGMLATVLVVICHTHVTVLPGVTVALPALLVPVLLTLCAVGAWVAVRLTRGFRSSPTWRPAVTGWAGPCPCRCWAGGAR